MRNRLFAAALSSGLALACTPEKAAPPAPAATPVDAGPAAKSVHVLVTGHEAGGLLKNGPRLLARWTQEDSWADAVVLSTGDSFSGAAVSSFFQGEPTAEAMKALGYRAQALGNHDLDLGFDTLLHFREQSGLSLLAANLKDKAGAEKPLHLPGTTIVERNGVKVGVVGLTGEKTLSTTVSGRASELELVPLDAAIPPALEALKQGGAQVSVLLIDDCFPVLKKVLDAHPDWKVDLVVGTRCDEAQEAKGEHTLYFSTADEAQTWVSATFTVPASGAVTATASRKTLVDGGATDQDLVTLEARWQKQLDEALGAKVAFTKKGFKEDAPALRTWIATALKEQAKADYGLINKKGIRAELPAGPVTKANIYSLIPFENAVLTVQVPGEALLKLKANPEAVLVGPAAIDAKKTYTLATTEYLYFGGDGLGLEAADPTPEPTGQMWQTAVVEWTQKLGSDEKKPLEKLLK
jgi:2',3'-cyclic-nucleotide 2'-phosphodiesterase (5'-nucleotidase family)